ncbi:MAG: Nuclear protein SET [Parcubacteria group bacterium GW2011_GWB1_43_6]|nr:MAG: Nuclear protein SET [Parcubacteria group bacterium GW2011_GWB1_43_6]
MISWFESKSRSQHITRRVTESHKSNYMKSWISPKTKKGLKSKIHGRGIFAIALIKKGEVVAIKKGHLLTGAQIKKLGTRHHYDLKIGDDLYIGPNCKDEFEDSMVFINHSCSPNAGFKGQQATFIAIKDIKKGEEIVLDYAMFDDDEKNIMKCNCGFSNCRKIITGKDWKNPKLQKKYKGCFSPFIQKKINK